MRSVADCARKSGRLKKTSLLEKFWIGCSDDVGAGRGHPQPSRNREEWVVGETTAIVVSSAGFIAAPTLRLLHGLPDNPFGVERVHAAKARNEKAFKSLKTHNYAKSLIRYS
jgi:hypothetical protein